MASGVCALPSECDRVSVAGKADACLVDTEEFRNSGPVFEHDLHTAAEEIGIHVLSDADADVDGDFQSVDRFENEVGKLIGGVVAVRIRAAKLCVARVHDELTDQMKDGFFIGEDAALLVALVEWIEELVDPPQRPTHVVHLAGHLIPERPLAGFAEGCGGSFTSRSLISAISRRFCRNCGRTSSSAMRRAAAACRPIQFWNPEDHMLPGRRTAPGPLRRC